MIDLYSGTPGSGKSLHTAERLYYWLRLGRPAICNFDIRLDYVNKKQPQKLKFYFVPNDELTPDYLICFAKDHFKGKVVKEDSPILAH